MSSKDGSVELGVTIPITKEFDCQDCEILQSPLDILKFWFGSSYEPTLTSIFERNTCEYINSRMPLWFSRSSPVFESMQIKNAAILEECKGQEGPSLLETNKDDPYYLLARIIICDQFPRSIYRGQTRAFSYDHLAVECVHIIIANNFYLDKYSAIERLFIVLSLQHSEDFESQKLGLMLAKDVASGAPTDVKEYFDNMKGFPMEHFQVIEQFGRFPSRNAAMDRESTPEEEAWLASPECPPWAKSQSVAKRN